MTSTGSHSGSRGSPRHWLLIAALLLINTYAFVDRAVLALLVEPIRRDLAGSDQQMGLLLGFGFAFVYAIVAIPAGHFVDRHNRRAIMAGASVLWAAMTIMCGTAHSMTQLFVGRAGVGFAESVMAPASFSLIRDAAPARSRGLAFSLYAMAPLAGMAASLLVGGHILALANAGRFGGLPLVGQLAPWQATMVLTGLVGLPLSLLLLLAPEPARPPLSADEPTPSGGILAGLRAALRHVAAHLPVFAPLIAFVTFGAMANFAEGAWLPALLGRSWGLTPQQVGPLMGVLVLTCGIGGLLFSGFALSWLAAGGGDIRNYGLIAAVGSTIGMIGIGVAPSLSVALIMVGTASFFLGTSFSVGATTLSHITPAALIGRVTAVYFLFISLLGQALGPFLVGYGSQRLFTGRTALAHSFALWTGIFGIGMIASVLLLRARLRRGNAEQHLSFADR